MLSVAPQTRVFVATQSIDFRRGIDGLAQACREKLTQDPMSGAIFVFSNRARTAVKILAYDGQGYWLCQKRFSKGRLKWWPKSELGVQTLAPRELQILLWNGHPQLASMAGDWKSIASASLLIVSL